MQLENLLLGKGRTHQVMKLAKLLEKMPNNVFEADAVGQRIVSCYFGAPRRSARR